MPRINIKAMMRNIDYSKSNGATAKATNNTKQPQYLKKNKSKGKLAAMLAGKENNQPVTKKVVDHSNMIASFFGNSSQSQNFNNISTTANTANTSSMFKNIVIQNMDPSQQD